MAEKKEGITTWEGQKILNDPAYVYYFLKPLENLQAGLLS